MSRGCTKMLDSAYLRMVGTSITSLFTCLYIHILHSEYIMLIIGGMKFCFIVTLKTIRWTILSAHISFPPF